MINVGVYFVEIYIKMAEKLQNELLESKNIKA